VYIFLPGGAWRELHQEVRGRGLFKGVQLITPGFPPIRTSSARVGDSMLGTFDAAHWALDLRQRRNRNS